jgi:hypothetical protein
MAVPLRARASIGLTTTQNTGHQNVVNAFNSVDAIGVMQQVKPKALLPCMQHPVSLQQCKLLACTAQFSFPELVKDPLPKQVLHNCTHAGTNQKMYGYCSGALLVTTFHCCSSRTAANTDRQLNDSNKVSTAKNVEPAMTYTQAK